MLSELKLLLIGCGKMGSAMLEGWIKGGVEPHNVTVIDPHATKTAFSDKCANILNDHSELEDTDFDICFIAVKPQVFREVVSNYKKVVRKGCVFVSVAAGITTKTIKECLGENARVIRVMPNLPATIKEGISGIFSDKNVSFEQTKSVIDILECNGEVIEVSSEDDIDKITAISGSGPGYIFLFIEAMEKIAMEYGFDETNAKLLSSQTVFGSAKLAKNSEISASELRQNVTSPGGTTEAALKMLMDEKEGLQSLLKKAIDSARDRSKELKL